MSGSWQMTPRTPQTQQRALGKVKGRHGERRAEPESTLCEPRSFILGAAFLPSIAPLQVRVMNIDAECISTECWLFLNIEVSALEWFGYF